MRLHCQLRAFAVGPVSLRPSGSSRPGAGQIRSQLRRDCRFHWSDFGYSESVLLEAWDQPATAEANQWKPLATKSNLEEYDHALRCQVHNHRSLP